MTRQELKSLWFSLDNSNVPVRKQIIVTMNKGTHWIGYGTIEVLSDGPNGYSSFKTHQEDPIHYGIMKKLEQPEYELIIDNIVIK